MRIWYYCSYKHSPVGFQLGCLDAKNPSEQLTPAGQVFASCEPLRILDWCLMSDKVAEAFGEIPETNQANPLYGAARHISEPDGEDVYLNLAFDTIDKAEFLSVVSFLKRYNDKELYRKMLPTVIKDVHNHQFGIRIDVDKLGGIVNELALGVGDTLESGFFIRTKYEEDRDGEVLLRELQLSQESFEIKPEPKLGSNCYSIRPKEVPVPPHPFPLARILLRILKMAIILVAIAGAIWIVMKTLNTIRIPQIP